MGTSAASPEESPREPADRPDRHEALLEAAERIGQFGSWQWIPTEGDLVWSDNHYRIFGLEPGEISPCPEYIYERAHPDDRAHLVQRVAELGGSGLFRTFDYRIVREDGVRHLRATLAVAEWREDQPHRLIGTVQDLTERRRTEREIEAHLAVTDVLTGWGSLETGAGLLLARLGGAMDCGAGTFWILRGDALEPHELWHDSLVEVPEFEAITEATRLPIGVALAGRAWETQQPAGVVWPGEGHASEREAAAVREGLCCSVAIPAIHREQVLAVVELSSREEVELTERLLRTLTAIGHELGQFLGRRRGELEGPVLTPRELQVLQLAAAGLSAKASAEQLFVSPATVRTHLEHIYTKLGVFDKASAVAEAMRSGLIH
jgi:DNA-binding CsgD family transcriptional regulator